MIPDILLTSLKAAGHGRAQSGLSDTINLKPGRIVDAKVLDVQPENRVQLLLSGNSEPGTAFDSERLVHGRVQQQSGGGKAAVSTSQTVSNEPGRPLPAGQKVQVATPLPLKPGMSLTLTAVATREGPVFKPVPSTMMPFSHSRSSTGTDAVLKILPESNKSSALPDSGVKPGLTVDAKVIDVTSQNRVQLLLGGQKLSVSTQLPLTRGMDIPMKVIRSGDGIVLKPVPVQSSPASTSTPGAVTGSTQGPAADFSKGQAVNAGKPMPSVPAALPDSTPLPGTDKSFPATSSQSFSLTKVFQGLSALSLAREPVLDNILMGLSLKSDVRDDQFLPKIIENMGLSFEKKLAGALDDTPDKKTVADVIRQLGGQDLKAASLSLAATESEPGKTLVLKHITDALDNFAQLNVKSGDSGQTQDGARFLLPFPVWTEDGFDFGQLMVDMGKGGTTNTREKMLSISFLLNMTALGPLRADFSILDKTIAGRFLLKDQATCDYLTPKISDLRQRLAGIGYQAGNIDCRVGEPDQIAPATLMLSMKTPDDIQGLNIVV